MNSRFYIKILEYSEPHFQGFNFTEYYYVLCIKVIYKNCFGKIKLAEKELNSISVTRAGVLNEKQIKEQLIKEFYNNRESTKIFRNIKRNEKKSINM